MNPEEIKDLIEKVIDDTTQYYGLFVVISCLVTIIIVFIIEYFRAKGKNLATKQDVEIITNKIEQVKANIQNDQEILKQKRKLKYSALLDSLELIDAFLSNFLKLEGVNIKKQYSTVEQTRKCHNNLILTCEDPEVLYLFTKIMFSKEGLKTEEIKQLIDEVNNYRNLVRKELGFGDDIHLDPDNMWFAKVNFENG